MKYLFAALAVLGLTLGTAAFAAPAHAYVYLHEANTTGGGNT